MNPFGWCMTARFTEKRFVHAKFLSQIEPLEKNSRHPLNAVTRRMGRAAALPYQTNPGRAALLRRPNFQPYTVRSR
jgi:hypothetical protein